VTGSFDLFKENNDQRTPYHSINFITCHDGFTLNDLVSYNDKHNDVNGEENRDGSNDNNSWNCGVEGPTEDAEIEALRNRQIKNALTLLFLSQGTPMLLYGDEMRRSALGNNNTVFQDNDLNWINWENAKKHEEILRFTRQIIHFRQRHALVRRRRYLTGEQDDTPMIRNISWHGVTPGHPDFGDGSRFIAWMLEAFQTGERSDVPIYIAANAYWEPLEIELPDTPDRRWYRVIDTTLPSGQDIVPEEEAAFLPTPKMTIQPRSTVVCVAR
jgi:glycogen operon protein